MERWTHRVVLRDAALQRYGGMRAPRLHARLGQRGEGRVEGRAVTAADTISARKSLAVPTVRVALRADATH